jgi:hypothetical protein
MAFSYSPKIVTEGLVLYLDAANPYSYVSGSLNWNDLSRSQISGSLQNNPGYNSGNGGSIVFDGSNDFVDLGNSSNVTTFTSLTINTWVKPVTLPLSFNQGRVIIRGDDSYRLYWYDNGGGTGNKLYFFSSHIGEIGLDNSVGYLTSNFTTNVWYNITALYNGSQTQLFVNGSLVATSTGKSGTISGTNNILLGKSNGNEYYLNGSMASIQLYNRALTQTEVLQNYNAQKSRFGLT